MRKTILLGAFGTLICLFTTAQKLSLQQFKNWKPRNIGPAGMSGRITAIDVVVRQYKYHLSRRCFRRCMEN